MVNKNGKGNTRRMKYIIMAGGDYSYWDKPKPMAELNGEPIIARTIRLLREAGVKDIAISSNNPVFKRFGVPVLKHNNPFTVVGEECFGYWVDCFYPTEEPACYIFGDVVFSPNAIRTIVEYDTDDITLFGSKKPFAPEYPKPYREPFAYKVANQKRFRNAIAEVKELHDIGVFKRHPIAWELWAVICGTPPNKINKSYVGINDYTCDIDNPSEISLYENLIGDK